METNAWIEKYMSNAEQMIYDGQVDQGLAVLKELLFEEPGYAALHNHLGWAYMYYASNNEQAKLHFAAAIKFAADFAPPYLHMGNLMNRLARYEEALQYFRQGLTKPDANRSALLDGMGYAYELRKEYKSAIRSYKNAAANTAAGHEVERMLTSVKRCRKKRIALLFSF